MLIIHIAITDNISIIHNSNNTIKRGTNPNNHAYGNSPVTIYIKGTKPMGYKTNGEQIPLILLPQR